MITAYQTFEELTATATAYMTSQGYSFKMIDHYQQRWQHVAKYMTERGIKEYAPDVGTQYLIDTIGETDTKDLPRSKRTCIRIVSSLSDFYVSGCFRKRKLYTPPEELTGEIGLAIAQYIIDFKQINGYARNTVQSHKLYLSRFLEYLNKSNIRSFASFKPEVMIDFAGSLTGYSATTRHFIILKTNRFLRYLHEQGVLPADYSTVTPKDKYVRQPKLPSYYSPEEISRLLKSIDRSNANGKRDYAMILLAVRLGLRRSDVINMKFDNIDWEHERIIFNQQKTKVPIELPLFPDIGNAIIDYLKYGRPQSDLPCVFLRLIPPYDHMNENALHGALQKYLRLSGIKYDERKHGPHALRHSLASNLLKQHVALPVISGVLGHARTESTIDYLRIDIESLRKCALEIPLKRKEASHDL
ncbi:MAG: site-specific integrase [Prevotella sp.]|nr:site-specific integrase [Prevotella sp.]